MILGTYLQVVPWRPGPAWFVYYEHSTNLRRYKDTKRNKD